MVTLSEVEDSSSAASQRLRCLADGNSRFVDEDWEGALDCFSRANDAVPGEPHAQALSRRAATHIKLQNFEDAISDANRAIEADASLAISYLRKGVACFELEEHEAALSAFQAGARLDPGNATFKKWIRKAQAELQEDESEPPVEAKPAPSAAPASQTPASPATSAPASTTTRAPTPAPAPAPSTPVPPPPKYRHEWYQSPSQVVITIFAKGVRPQQLHADFGEQVLSVTIDGEGEEEPYVLALRLFGKIDPSASKHVLLSTKVELRLTKAEAIQWTGLEAALRAKAAVVQPINVSTDAPGVKSAYPSSSKQKVDWNKLEQEVKKEEKEEKLDGDAGLNKFFREIYGDADEETRRAMNKSFVESGGTVLSTNWKDVGKGKVEHKD